MTDEQDRMLRAGDLSDREPFTGILRAVQRNVEELRQVIDGRVMGALTKVADQIVGVHQQQVWLRAELERLHEEQIHTRVEVATVDTRVGVLEVREGERGLQMAAMHTDAADLRESRDAVVIRVDRLESKAVELEQRIELVVPRTVTPMSDRASIVFLLLCCVGSSFATLALGWLASR